jgi:hypothetical protein
MSFPFELHTPESIARDAIEKVAREHAEKLERFHGRITRGRIVIETDGAHPPVHEVKLELSIPGGEVVVKREGPDAAHVVREAFAAARRRIQDRVRRRRGDVKAHSH